MIPVVLAMPAGLPEAYARLGSVHKAAAEAGVSHSVAHRRLTGAGLMRHKAGLSDEDLEVIRTAYEAASGGRLDLRALALRLGRTRPVVSRAAGEMGLTSYRRPKPGHVVAALTKATDERNARGDHPRGFAGHTHSEGSRRIMGRKSADAWLVAKTFGIGLMSEANQQRRSDLATQRMALASAEGAYSRTKAGRRKDLGETYFRSAWEANYARYLNWLMSRGDIVSWDYEPTTFWFEAIRRGVRSYKPDFFITEAEHSYYVEVKGWMDPKSKTKLQRMKKYHPTVEVRLVGEKQYRELQSKLGRIIPNWEGRR